MLFYENDDDTNNNNKSGEDNNKENHHNQDNHKKIYKFINIYLSVFFFRGRGDFYGSNAIICKP